MRVQIDTSSMIVSDLMIKMNVDRKRSLAKAISWRFIATITGALIVYALIGEFEAAGQFMVADVILKLMFYYIHERGWEKLKWGRESPMISESA